MLQLDGFKMTHCLNCRMNGKTPFPSQFTRFTHFKNETTNTNFILSINVYKKKIIILQTCEFANIMPRFYICVKITICSRYFVISYAIRIEIERNCYNKFLLI